MKYYLEEYISRDYLDFLNCMSLAKVPLPESWPDNLTEKPSVSKVPNAKLSAVDQSIALPSSIALSLKSNIFFKVL